MSNEIYNLYEFGSFKFDSKTDTLWREKQRIPLSPKAIELLKLLIEKQGEVVSKQEIFDKVWAETFVEDGVLTQNIYTLRQALGTDENGKHLIENIARRGYRLTIPVTISDLREVRDAGQALAGELGRRNRFHQRQQPLRILLGREHL